MDMLMVACGPPTDANKAEIVPGDYAVCYGEGGPSLKDMAGLLKTAQSDVTCKIARRVRRLYTNAPPPGPLSAIGA